MSNSTSNLKPWKQPGYNPETDTLNSYGFLPSEGLGIAFVVLYALGFIAHSYLVVASRRWWFLNVLAGTAVELIGWGGRIWGAINPDSDNSFLIQTVCLIIAPAFYSAILYAILGWVIVRIGPQYSLLKPKVYWYIFVACDFVSLILQAVGGAKASGANTQIEEDIGTHIMVGGIVFQLLCTIAFAILAILFVNKAKKDGVLFCGQRHHARLELLLKATALSAACIIVRGIYRTVELSQGWNGYLIQHQYFFLFDSIPMVTLLFVLAAAHPHWTLPRASAPQPLISKVEEGYAGIASK